MKLFKKHNPSLKELETQETKTGKDNKKEEQELSPFEREEQVTSKVFAEAPEYCGDHKVDIHMNDGSILSYEYNDKGIMWLLTNMACQTNAALQWDPTNKHHRAINMKKVAYIEFNTIKDKEDDNEEVA